MMFLIKMAESNGNMTHILGVGQATPVSTLISPPSSAKYVPNMIVRHYLQLILAVQIILWDRC